MTLLRSKTRGELEPTWDIALIFPNQGQWDESDYLIATETTNRLVELRDGHLEVLTMPTPAHQRIVSFLNQLLLAYLARNPLGEVLFAPLRVRLWEKTFREPDIVFMLSKHAKRMGEEFWEGADFVMEVVSGSAEDRRRDLIVKRREYAKAGIDEYWIVDPKEQRILVLKRRGKSYVAHSEARTKGRAESALLRGFAVDAQDVFSAASTSEH
jgi:Uma2 family endonuclease